MLLHCWWECKLVQLLWKTVSSFLQKKLKLEMPYDPAIPLLSICPEKKKKKKPVIQKDTCTCTFIAALFIKAKTWKQPKCPLTGTMDHCMHASQVASVMSNSLQPYEL